MAIDPTTTTTIKVGDLQSAAYSTTDLIPHEVGGYLKKGNLQDLATFIGEIIDVTGGVGFRAVEVNDGETLPATEDQEFILVGPGTFPNVGGGATITTTEPLNALVSNGTYWFIGVEIPITASGVWGTISGVLSDQTDLNNVLVAKADLIDGKVPNTQLPSYVDDVIEVANYAALPATGESGKIYVTIDTGNVYRWSGSAYIRIADESPVWGIITGDLEDQTDLQNALNGKYPVPTGDTTQYIAGDGTLISFPVAGQAGTLVREVKNTTGASLTKGTVVYLSGASGNKPTVAKANASSDATSAQTFGLIQADLANNATGYVVCAGDLIGLDTSAYDAGTQLYLSATVSGTYTSTKQSAPAHLVYVGVVTRSSSTLGQIEVKIQNGYELDELHDVAISSKTNNQVLVYESSTDLWKNKSLGTILGGTSSQFVKGDGSLDSNTYALDNVVVKLTGDQSISGIKTFSSQIKSNILLINESGGFSGATGYTQLGGTADYFQIVNGGGSKQTKFIHTGVRNITMPAADGTMALTSQIPTVSGTTNYVPKFTGSNTIGDSVIFDDGTQIGIGTNVPQRKLSVRDVNNTYGATFSGSAGLNMVAIGTVSGATNGVPSIAAFTNSFGATTNLAINPTGGNVGIGTTSPATLLQVKGNGNNMISLQYASDGGAAGYGFYNSAGTELWSIGGGRFVAQDALEFSRQGSLKMLINSSGNVSIGTTTLGVKFQVAGGTNSETPTFGSGTVGTSAILAANGLYGLYTGVANSGHVWQQVQRNDGSTAVYPLALQPSGGTVCIGTVTAFDSGLVCSDGGTTYVPYTAKIGTTASSTQMFFRNPNGVVGSISTSGTLTSFNVTSDYRLKQDFKQFNGLDLVSKIKVYDYEWKADNSRMNGVIAHELQEVVPYAVTGEKDAEQMQSVDYSKLVPILVQAIQELKAEIEILKNK